MYKKTIVIFIIILIVIAAVVIGTGSFLSKNSPKEEPVAVVDEVKIEKPAPAPLEKEKITEKYYTLELEYPKNAGTNFPEISAYIETVRSDFMQFVPKTDEEAAYQNVNEQRAYALKTTTATYTSSSTVTYKLETYMYTGGAHGGTFVATFTYTPDGKFIPLGNLLTSSDSLNKLSSAARNYLYDKLGSSGQKSEIDAGTEPKEQNFSAWYLTDKTITFVFQQYQIGPYVLGIQEFPMSRAEAKTILNI